MLQGSVDHRNLDNWTILIGDLTLSSANPETGDSTKEFFEMGYLVKLVYKDFRMAIPSAKVEYNMRKTRDSKEDLSRLLSDANP